MDPQEPDDNVKTGLDYVRQRYGQAEPSAYDDGGHTEPAPPPTLAEQVRDLERTIERVREAVGTDQPVDPQRNDELQVLRNEIGWLKERIGLMRSALRDAFDLPDDEAIDVVGSARQALDEARNWARHGYEIGQRHCGWTDHGVAPEWLTEGWPPSFDSCEHLQRASEYDTALTRVRGLAYSPEVMNAQHPHPEAYLEGYSAAIHTAKRAARVNLTAEEQDRELDRRDAMLNKARAAAEQEGRPS